MKWLLIFWIYGCSSADAVCETGDYLVEEKASFTECRTAMNAWQASGKPGHEHRAYCLPADRGVVPDAG